ALYAGLRLAGPADHYEKAVAEFSKNLGVAFQVLNDLKDWTADEDNKRVAGGDVLAARPTLLLALALEGLPPAEREELLGLRRRRPGGGRPESRGSAVREGPGVRQGREARREVPRQGGGHRR